MKIINYYTVHLRWDAYIITTIQCNLFILCHDIYYVMYIYIYMYVCIYIYIYIKFEYIY